MATIKNYKEITLEYMMDYIEKLNDNNAKKAFKENAFSVRPHRKSVPVLDTNGNPVMKQAKDKAGNLKFTADGKPMMIQARQMVDVAGETQEVFNLLKAQRYFCKTYMPELLPEKKAKKKASDALKNW